MINKIKILIGSILIDLVIRYYYDDLTITLSDQYEKYMLLEYGVNNMSELADLIQDQKNNELNNTNQFHL